MPLRSRSLRDASFLICGILSFGPSQAASQTSATVLVDENFRREPNGVILAQLLPGAEVRVLQTEGNWSEVQLGGWVWLRSLEVSDDAAFDLVVSVPEGENLRAAPSGTILGRLEEGVLLEEGERDPAWARVSRTGWIWSASLSEGASPPAGDATPAPGPLVTEGPAARAPGGYVSAGGGAILTAPDGDTLAVATPAGDVEVVGREGSWARVRLEGWMWMPPTQETGRETEVEAAAGALEPADLALTPEAHAGRVVSWRVQFISLERAEAVRTDFFEGEPFLLTRFGGGDGPFVYIAVPTDRLSDVEGLVPLERVSITGRVRTGASALTGTPIVDLIAIERGGEAP